MRNSNECTSTWNQRPDYGFLLNNICPFRGEETGGNIKKSEISDKLFWVYNPTPFMFGYYATGPLFTLVAITPPQTLTSRMTSQ